MKLVERLWEDGGSARGIYSSSQYKVDQAGSDEETKSTPERTNECIAEQLDTYKNLTGHATGSPKNALAV